MNMLFQQFTNDYPPINGPAVSVIVSSMRAYALQTIYNNFIRQDYINKELVLVLHQDDVDEDYVLDLISSIGNVTVVQVPSLIKFGECLNIAVSHTNGEYVTKMDDDDIYLAPYVSDCVETIKKTGADLIGKRSQYIYLECFDKTYLSKQGKNKSLRYCFPFSSNLTGGTLFGKKELFRVVPFRNIPMNIDYYFVKDALKLRKRIYISHPYYYLRKRHRNKELHTSGGSDVVRFLSAYLIGSIKYIGPGFKEAYCDNRA